LVGVAPVRSCGCGLGCVGCPRVSPA
jgi:hypothetical protein